MNTPDAVAHLSVRHDVASMTEDDRLLEGVARGDLSAVAGALALGAAWIAMTWRSSAWSAASSLGKRGL